MSEETAARQVVALKAHLALNVRNVERSKEFYRKLFGLEPSKERRGYAKFDAQNPPLNLTLNEAAFQERGALSHLGIQVAATSDVLALRDEWKARGLETRDEMQTNCCYAIQDKAWVSDPDGNQWEVFVVLEDNLSETTMCCATNVAMAEEVTAIASSSEERATEENATAETATVSSPMVLEAAAAEAACCEPMAAGTCLTEPCCTNDAVAPIAISR
jgi:catechol 2,3-dioxygenase-like lactoylglutathione lyase family enzyme